MQVYVLLVLCVLFWSANFVLGRFVAGAIEPWELAFFRWLGVFVVTLPFLLFHGKKIWTALKHHFWILALLSALGIAGFNALLYIGLQYTTATNATLFKLFNQRSFTEARRRFSKVLCWRQFDKRQRIAFVHRR